MIRKTLVVLILTCLANANLAGAFSFDLPGSKHGLSFGNSINFTGIRFNVQDKYAETINGVNFTLWGGGHQADLFAETVNGLSLGLQPTAGEINGVALSGFSVVSNRLHGFAFAPYGVDATEQMQGLALGGLWVGGRNSAVQGVALAGLWSTAKTLEGLSLGAVNLTQKTTGVQIGLFNRTQDLNGIQIGLLNYAGNNPAGLKLLPGINMNFSF